MLYNMTSSNKQICILLLSITDCYNTILIKNTASLWKLLPLPFQTHNVWLVSLRKNVLADRQRYDLLFPSVCTEQRNKLWWSTCLRRERKECCLQKFFINRTLIRRLCSAFNVWLTGDLLDECRARWKPVDWNLQIVICGGLCAENLNKSWDWILILTPCSDFSNC